MLPPCSKFTAVPGDTSAGGGGGGDSCEQQAYNVRSSLHL